MRELEDRLRRLSINDPQGLTAVLAPGAADEGLDPRSAALVRLGVLIALDGPARSFEWAADAALASGATSEELVGVLVAVAPLVGSAHVVSAAPRLALALGYDLDADLERLDRVGTSGR
jgi:4-carboxymuconolactone decarboxylase